MGCMDLWFVEIWRHTHYQNPYCVSFAAIASFLFVASGTISHFIFILNYAHNLINHSCFYFCFSLSLSLNFLNPRPNYSLHFCHLIRSNIFFAAFPQSIFHFPLRTLPIGDSLFLLPEEQILLPVDSLFIPRESDSALAFKSFYFSLPSLSISIKNILVPF